MNTQTVLTLTICSFLAAFGCGAMDNQESQPQTFAQETSEASATAKKPKPESNKPKRKDCETPPANSFNKPCGECGGTFDCFGMCQAPNPDPDCLACGGQATCFGGCSVDFAPNFGEPCDDGGRIGCLGTCDFPTSTN